jgi:hypothetical protein
LLRQTLFSAGLVYFNTGTSLCFRSNVATQT